MTNTNATPELPRTYRIPSENMPELRETMLKIAKRAVKLHVPAPDLIQVGCERDEDEDGRVTTTYLMQVTGSRVHLAGWTFLAKIEHLGADGNLVSAVPGVTSGVLAPYWHADPNCTHCNVKRSRRTTYVLRHDDGRVAQVGSTCLADHLEGQDPTKVLAQMELLAALGSACGEGELGSGGRGKDTASLVSVVALACAVARRDGWLSRTKARELAGGNVGRGATADIVWGALFPSPQGEADARATLALVTDDDRAFARGAVEAAQQIEPLSDYEHNLRVIASVPAIDRRMAGLGASIYVWQRHRLDLGIERAGRKPSRHLGTVGSPICVEARLVRVAHFDGQFATVHLHKFETVDGAQVLWTTSSASHGEGKTYRVWGKVKAHSEYQGVAQTEITRPGVVELEGPIRENGEIDLATWDAKPAKKARAPRKPAKRVAVDHVAAAKNFQVGDHVEFDGSGDARFPRLYRGVVKEIEENGLMLVVTDEWSAQCMVPAGRAWLIKGHANG